jgi:hypothetical protein
MDKWLGKAILIGAQEGCAHTLKRTLIKPMAKYRSSMLAWKY